MRIYKVCLRRGKLFFNDGTNRPATQEEARLFTKRDVLRAYEDKDGNRHVFRWADLHRHSGYSILDGCIRIPDMVKHTEFCGALTDHGNMYGSLQFYNAMRDAGKLPIIGEEFYCETIAGKKDGNHLILLAKNKTGYANLIKLSSEAYNNFYRKPHISYEMLRKYHEGLICTSACIGGEIPQAILHSDPVSLEKIIMFFKETFEDDFYLEVQRHGIEDEKKVNEKIFELAAEHNIKVVGTTDAHYLNKDSELAHDVLLCVSTQTDMSDPKRLKFEGTGYHIHTADEVEELFSDHLECLDNTLEIADKCADMEIELGKYYLPDFPLPSPFTSEYDYLYDLARRGFIDRYAGMLTVRDGDSPEAIADKKAKKTEYWERFQFEMNTIKKMGFSGYFLIVWDFLDFCHKNQIPTGPGRGSGAGSIVLYCMRITDMDPMKYDLLFERFLNPDRISMPDIDSDISERHREKVIEYVTQKYGADRVSHIVTFGTFAAKQALYDAAKALGYSVGDARAITKMVPNAPKMTIKKAMQENPELEAHMHSTKDLERVLNVALNLEGIPRNISLHACGICISKTEMTDYVPETIIKDEDTNTAVVSTQYNMTECEDRGVLKMDFLGLRTLDVLQDAVDLINKDYGLKLDINSIPINDVKVYKNLAEGHTQGVFQFESGGMTDLVQKMYADVDINHPERGDEYFNRLIAAVALYRPGPMDEIPNYIKSMRSGKIHYDHPLLEGILANTYGIFVYQEQVMLAVRALAGFTPGQADKVRKGMGKKIEAIITEYGEYFVNGSEKHDAEHPDSPYNINGCVKNGIDKQLAEQIWEKMRKFGEYAFNKSHATCYAALGARTAWLAYYYPEEYMAGLMNSFLGNTEKLSWYVNVCHEMGITILPPDINESKRGFVVVKQDDSKVIRFGLSGIKSVGPAASESILAERKSGGEFKSLGDFLERMALSGGYMNKAAIEALFYAGAFDCFEGTRAAKIAALPKMLDSLKSLKKEDKAQVSFLDSLGIEKMVVRLDDIPEFDFIQKAVKEYEYLGIFIEHPITGFSERLAQSFKITKISDLENVSNNTNVSIAGIVLNVDSRSYRNKMGKPGSMTNFTVSDETGSVRCTAFNSTAVECLSCFHQYSIAMITGRVKKDDFGTSITIDAMNAIPGDWRKDA